MCYISGRGQRGKTSTTKTLPSRQVKKAVLAFPWLAFIFTERKGGLYNCMNGGKSIDRLQVPKSKQSHTKTRNTNHFFKIILWVVSENECSYSLTMLKLILVSRQFWKFKRSIKVGFDYNYEKNQFGFGTLLQRATLTWGTVLVRW